MVDEQTDEKPNRKCGRHFNYEEGETKIDNLGEATSVRVISMMMTQLFGIRVCPRPSPTKFMFMLLIFRKN